MSTPFWKDPVFTVGQEVVCNYADGYHFLKAGNRYKVLDYAPRRVDPTFTWPALVTVSADDGRPNVCHASRFGVLPEGAT